jgi:hypothetical protein
VYGVRATSWWSSRPRGRPCSRKQPCEDPYGSFILCLRGACGIAIPLTHNQSKLPASGHSLLG